jgi:hypothetical protein
VELDSVDFARPMAPIPRVDQRDGHLLGRGDGRELCV